MASKWQIFFKDSQFKIGNNKRQVFYLGIEDSLKQNKSYRENLPCNLTGMAVNALC